MGQIARTCRLLRDLDSLDGILLSSGQNRVILAGTASVNQSRYVLLRRRLKSSRCRGRVVQWLRT